MADTVTSKTLLDSERYHIVQLTNESDGTGESTVTKVDVSGLSGSPSTVTIDEIWYAAQGMSVKLLWDADTNVLAYNIPENEIGHIDFGSIGGLKNNAGAGVNGDILLTTVGHAAGDSYHIVLKVRKDG